MFRILALILLLAGVAAPADPDTVNTVPSSGSNFQTQLQTFLKNEDANRHAELFQPHVVSGCLGVTSVSLTHTPTSCIAYPAGYRVTEAGSITYPPNSKCWVAINKATAGDISTTGGLFIRVAGTHYVMACTGLDTVPPEPSQSLRIMKVTTSGTAVTAVVDHRSEKPVTNSRMSPGAAIASFYSITASPGIGCTVAGEVILSSPGGVLNYTKKYVLIAGSFQVNINNASGATQTLQLVARRCTGSCVATGWAEILSFPNGFNTRYTIPYFIVDTLTTPSLHYYDILCTASHASVTVSPALNAVAAFQTLEF